VIGKTPGPAYFSGTLTREVDIVNDLTTSSGLNNNDVAYKVHSKSLETPEGVTRSCKSKTRQLIG
jgi:hypothetical protein